MTSTFKNSVTEALDFRNRFADQPFLCKSVIDSRSVAVRFSLLNERKNA